jgi:hypothetical protein
MTHQQPPGDGARGCYIISRTSVPLPEVKGEFLGGRGRYQHRAEGQRGSRNGYETGRLHSAEGAIEVKVPQGPRSG